MNVEQMTTSERRNDHQQCVENVNFDQIAGFDESIDSLNSRRGEDQRARRKSTFLAQKSWNWHHIYIAPDSKIGGTRRLYCSISARGGVAALFFGGRRDVHSLLVLTFHKIDMAEHGTSSSSISEQQ